VRCVCQVGNIDRPTHRKEQIGSQWREKAGSRRRKLDLRMLQVNILLCKTLTLELYHDGTLQDVFKTVSGYGSGYFLEKP